MANLIELFDNIVQMQNLNGVPLANGKLYVYALGRTRLMDTWSDVDGESLNTNPIILDDAGQAHCFVSDDFDYTLVVCDAYDNEIFSIDKYLYSKGEHSHADVAVAPSEHIGVSSYHVGETTVYVPYIQGELGKTYHGIEPIVVNNQENKISARNIPLGVQSPLYFAEDSESACIIAMSGEYQPVTGMSGYATTGDLVDLATSVSETYQPKGDYATKDELSGFMEESKLETADGKITGYDGTAFAGGGTVDPSEFIPWSASGNFATSGDLNGKLDTTAFSTVSGDFITAIPDTYASKDFVLSSVSSKLDSTAFSTVSGDFITALPEGLLNESGFEYDGDKISAYNGSAFVGQGGGELSGYELSAGNGISIDNYPIEQKTVISVTGNYATEDWVTGQIDTKLDSAIYAEDSGKFLTAHQDLSNYATLENVESATSGKANISATIPVVSSFYPVVTATDYVGVVADTIGNFYQIVERTGEPESAWVVTYTKDSIYRNVYWENHSGPWKSGSWSVSPDYIEFPFFTASQNNLYFGDVWINPPNYFNIKEVISAGSDNPIWIRGRNELFSGGQGQGFTFSSNNTGFGTAQLTVNYYTSPIVQIPSPKFEVRNPSGAGFSIEASAAKGYDHNGNVTWDTTKAPAPEQLIGGADSTKPSILLSPYMPKSMSAQFSNAPLFSADGNGIFIGNSGQNLNARMGGLISRNGYVKAEFADNSGNITGYSYLTGHDVGVYRSSAFGSANSGNWTLTQSVQKREIECDTATSAITAIAGSAIGGGVPQSAFDELKQSYDALSALFATYSGKWLLPEEGEE